MDACGNNGGNSSSSNNFVTVMKLIAASALFYSAGTSFAETYHQMANHHRATSSSSSSSTSSSASSIANLDPVDLGMSAPSNHVYANTHITGIGSDSQHQQRGRRLTDYASSSTKNPPSYMKGLMDDLKARKKLMEETPPEEVKYWFEYTGPLQVRFTSMHCCSSLLCGKFVCVALCPFRVEKCNGEGRGRLE